MRINSIALNSYTAPKNTSFKALSAKMKEKNELNKMAPVVREKADEIYANIQAESAVADEKVHSAIDRMFEIHKALRRDFAHEMKIEPLKYNKDAGAGAVSTIARDIARIIPAQEGKVKFDSEDGAITVLKKTLHNENSYTEKEKTLLTIVDEKNAGKILNIEFSNNNSKFEGFITEMNPKGSSDKIIFDGNEYASTRATEVQKNSRTTASEQELAAERFVFRRNGVKEYYKNWAYQKDDFCPSIGKNAVSEYGFKFHFDKGYVKVTGNSHMEERDALLGFDKYYELIGKRFRKISGVEF
ncbi:hypothetical protein IJC60_01555 [bacterium]|nr:hypothetical protein [bacterium]